MRFSICQHSEIGGRKVNQDRLAYSYSKDVLLMVIADGMGGHARGEIAAEIAVNTINNRFQTEARTALRRPREFMDAAIHAAHRAIVAFADVNEMLECPRTTVVVCVVQNGRAFWAHVGDSRLYVFRDGKLAATTLDHSRVQQMLDAGAINAAEAAVHPDRNKIYNCLGGVLPPAITHSEEWTLAVRDSIVLSTDGFWGQVDSSFIAARLTREDITEAMSKLMTEAERRAGTESDNLSLVAFTWERQEDEEPDSNSALTVPGEFFTSSQRTTPDLFAHKEEISDAEIERAIAEIQDAIRKVK